MGREKKLYRFPSFVDPLGALTGICLCRKGQCKMIEFFLYTQIKLKFWGKIDEAPV